MPDNFGLRIGVNAVEQLNGTFHFASKYGEAKKRILSMLDKKGIYIDDELDNCIESVVAEFNKYKSKEKIPEDSKGAEVTDI